MVLCGGRCGCPRCVCLGGGAYSRTPRPRRRATLAARAVLGWAAPAPAATLCARSIMSASMSPRSQSSMCVSGGATLSRSTARRRAATLGGTHRHLVQRAGSPHCVHTGRPGGVAAPGARCLCVVAATTHSSRRRGAASQYPADSLSCVRAWRTPGPGSLIGWRPRSAEGRHGVRGGWQHPHSSTAPAQRARSPCPHGIVREMRQLWRRARNITCVRTPV